MVVTLRTGHRQPENRIGGRVDDVNLDVVDDLYNVYVVAAEACRGEKSGRDQILVGIGLDLIARYLLAYEFRKRLVAIEAADDIVSVTPDSTEGYVRIVAFGLGEACDVEPVSAPSFAVSCLLYTSPRPRDRGW